MLMILRCTSSGSGDQADDDIEMYQFGIGGSGRTVIEKLNRTPYGFEVPTFNRVLAETIQEVRAFQEDAQK